MCIVFGTERKKLFNGPKYDTMLCFMQFDRALEQMFISTRQTNQSCASLKELGDLVSTSSLSLSEYKLEITIGQMHLFYRTGWNTKRDTKKQESRELRVLLLPQSSWNPKVWMAMTSGCRQLSMISWRSFDNQVVLSTGLDEDAYKLKSY